jgi:hypothetical protein
MIKRTLVALAALVATVSGALPATTLAGKPVFVADIEKKIFVLKTRVAITGEPDEVYSEGRADFSISVTVTSEKGDFTAEQSCDDEVYLFEDGALKFNPYSEKDQPLIGACTRQFLNKMASGFGRSFPLSVLELVLDDGGRKLIFDFFGTKVVLEREYDCVV